MSCPFRGRMVLIKTFGQRVFRLMAITSTLWMVAWWALWSSFNAWLSRQLVCTAKFSDLLNSIGPENLDFLRYDPGISCFVVTSRKCHIHLKVSIMSRFHQFLYIALLLWKVINWPYKWQDQWVYNTCHCYPNFHPKVPLYWKNQALKSQLPSKEWELSIWRSWEDGCFAN